MSRSARASTEKASAGLKPRQLKALSLIIAGHSLQEVADQLGITRQTVSKWSNHNEEFRAELSELKEQARDELANMLPGTSAHMLVRLRKIASDTPNAVALEAIKYFFERFEPKREDSTGVAGAGLTQEDILLMRVVAQLQQRDEKELN